MNPKASVIVAFYNNLEFLELVLAGFQRQNFRSFEVVIADDGSTQSVVNELETLKKNYEFPIRHVWHEDNGWRKNIILNKAVEIAEGNYLIFIDADCIPHQSFVNDHWQSRKRGSFQAGRRVHLSPRINQKLDVSEVKSGCLEKPSRYFIDSLKSRPKTKNAEKAIRIPSSILRSLVNQRKKKLLGCNMSMFKEDLLTLNGFDERYLHPGTGEDVDLNLRAVNAGFEIKSLQWSAIQYHIWHKSNNPTRHPDNLKILQENSQNKISATVYSRFYNK